MIPTDDLRAQHVATLRTMIHSREDSEVCICAECRALRFAVAALSALPAGGGAAPHGTRRWEQAADTATAEGLRVGGHEWWQRIREQLTTPPPDAAVGAQGEKFPKCGCGRPGEYESEDGPACNKYFRCKEPAAPAARKGVDDAMVERALSAVVGTSVFTYRVRDFITPSANFSVGDVMRAALEAALTRQPVAGDGPEQLTLQELVRALAQHHKDISGDTRAFPAAQVAAETAGALWRIIRAHRRTAPAATPTDGGHSFRDYPND